MTLSPLPLLALGLAACHDSDGSAPGLLTNTGVSANIVLGRGELWFVGVFEPEEGAQDRNGDGDADDLVASVLDLADGSLTQLGLATGTLPFLAIGNVLVAFGVVEADQGHADLNADGDDQDTVLHVYDSGTRTTINTGLALGSLQPVIGAGVVAFAVSEVAQGSTDLDASGTAVGQVLHVFDADTGLTTNALRSVTSPITFHDHAFAFTTDEASAGEELNDDGDQDDLNVLQLFDLGIGGILSVPLAVRGAPLAVGADEWYVLVDEATQGADLNDDGDLDEGVYFAVEPHLEVHENLGFGALGSFGSISDGTRLALVVMEVDGLDRDGDGDLFDSFVALVQPGVAATVVSDVPIALGRPLLFAGERLGFLVREEDVDSDLNGNGSLLDEVLHRMDTLTGAITSTGLEALSLQLAGERFVFARFEQSGSLEDDRNGDGDVSDLVYGYLDGVTGTLGDTHVASAGILEASARELLVLASEQAQGGDLNGDGDEGDFVWYLHDLATTANLDLGVASVGNAGLLADGRGVVQVDEGGQGPGLGTDLNGDGDTHDFVVHTLRAH